VSESELQLLHELPGESPAARLFVRLKAFSLFRL
jgi:hypothetical protein